MKKTATATKTNVAQFRGELTSALTALEAKYGIHSRVGRMQKDEHGFHFSVQAETVPTVEQPEDAETKKSTMLYRTLFKHSHFADEHPDWLGKQVVYKGALATIIGASSNRSNGRIAVRLGRIVRFLTPEKIEVGLKKAQAK